MKEQQRVRALTLKELAGRYGISTKTMTRWIQRHESDIGKKIGHFYMYHQVKKMVELFGPFKLEISSDLITSPH